MNAIDNSGLLNYCQTGCAIAGFTPVVGYTYNAGTGAVVATDGSTIPATDAFKKIHVKLTDQFGGEVRGVISAAAGNVTISALGLNRSKPLDLRATVITDDNVVSDGGAYNIQAAGNILNWDTQANATV